MMRRALANNVTCAPLSWLFVAAYTTTGATTHSQSGEGRPLFSFWQSGVTHKGNRAELGMGPSMGLNLEAYAALRPMLYHCTARSNLASIRVGRALHSVTVLAPGRQLLRRLDDEVVEYDEHLITLRDQRALQPGHVGFTGSSSWNDVVAANNSRVFFWPGTEDSPIRHGHRFWEKYRVRPDTMLRMGFEELRQINPGVLPYFCRFNSGAPRTVQGRRSPRGPDTFLLAHEWPYPPSHVVEVSFIGSVSLPPTTDVWDGARGWQRL